ncbi:hypothetical protein SCA03_69330 [Streptomyces cacaoi]|uniref:Uncharacterized protein n=1 Tax=Streptomyces cacaoi TaxID=1898 RepID=A0A4Y3R9P2_STRCI|nr:hypothetical protein SCA03_69330 [Streptomyces cacaoi]
MRDCIALLSIWLGEPARRTLRAARQRSMDLLTRPEPPRANAVPPPVPNYRRGPVPAHVREREGPVDGEENVLVRPYYVVHERTCDTEASCE